MRQKLAPPPTPAVAPAPLSQFEAMLLTAQREIEDECPADALPLLVAEGNVLRETLAREHAAAPRSISEWEDNQTLVFFRRELDDARTRSMQNLAYHRSAPQRFKAGLKALQQRQARHQVAHVGISRRDLQYELGSRGVALSPEDLQSLRDPTKPPLPGDVLAYEAWLDKQRLDAQRQAGEGVVVVPASGPDREAAQQEAMRAREAVEVHEDEEAAFELRMQERENRIRQERDERAHRAAVWAPTPATAPEPDESPPTAGSQETP